MLTDRFAEALVFAERLHRRQRRKGTGIPYVAHLLAVSATVLEYGGDEDTAIAALLHDAVEDQGGLPTLREIEAKFGRRVATIVEACTDSLSEDPAAKLPWEDRKRAYLAHLAHADADVALVAAADKLHNLTAMIRDVRRDGPAAMSRFKAPPDRQIWYFRKVVEALDRHRATVPVEEIERGIETLAGLLSPAAPAPTG
jgi:(p)ppGpp synthase/HD superfamily hydrolase